MRYCIIVSAPKINNEKTHSFAIQSFLRQRINIPEVINKQREKKVPFSWLLRKSIASLVCCVLLISLLNIYFFNDVIFILFREYVLW